MSNFISHEQFCISLPRRRGLPLLGGAGAADAVALHGAAPPRDAEPGGAHEGPVRHHAEPVPLLARAHARARAPRRL